MPYQSTVTSNILLATTSAVGANLSNLLFATEHTYFPERIRAYSSIEEVRNDDAIPATSVAYTALLQAFKQPGVSTPVYLGRRQADSLTLAADPILSNAEYSFIITVVDDATNTPVTNVVSITSDSDATEEEIATAIFTDMTVTSPVSNVTVTDETGSVKIVAAAGYDFSVTKITNLVDSYETTETAAQLLAALTEEDNQSWYWFTCSDHSETFVLAMGAEIEATASSDYPKQYRFSVQEAATLVALADPAVDIMGKCKEQGFTRTHADWHHEANTIFPEVAVVAYNGQFEAGSTTWKIMSNLNGVTTAADLVTGKALSTAKQGFISDRYGNWKGVERGISFMHGGKNFAGEWIDVIHLVDKINSEIEVAGLNLLYNQPGGKIQLNPQGKSLVKGVVRKVLQDNVASGGLTGYENITIPDDTPFVDQTNRILQNVKWTGYLSSAVHFIVVDGILTYQQAGLE